MGFPEQTRCSLVRVIVFSAALATLGNDVSLRHTAPVVPEIIDTALQVSQPGVLSREDQALYREAFALQRAGQVAQADAALARVSNALLKPVVLAERYLSPRYAASYEELAAWLAQHADAPAAEALYKLALTRQPEKTAPLAEPVVAKLVKITVPGGQRTELYGHKEWLAGLAAFRKGDMDSAVRYFRTLADGDTAFEADDDSAVAFWTYRALKAQGQEALARHYLEQAADAPVSFYSILATTALGGPVAGSAAPLTAQQEAALLQEQGVRRAVALKTLGEDALAVAELRTLYARAPQVQRASLAPLARKLGLPTSGLRMAYHAQKDDFPLPVWEPTSGYQVERALLFAIMRQESGFNPNARSAQGALGLMQLMPATVNAMNRGSARPLNKSLDPEVNMALGQRYIEHLMDSPGIGDNLFYLAAAYNAGPGNVASWLRKGAAHPDPLVFVESIPNVQTRDYVQHVMANYWIYSDMLGVDKTTSLTSVASGVWPRYEGAERQLVSLLTRVD